MLRQGEIPSIRTESDHELRFMIPVHVERAGGYLYVLDSKVSANLSRTKAPSLLEREANALPAEALAPINSVEFGLPLKAF